ncbi:MAG: 50S ribosomal protein L15 [Gammaproteobacteria bacterium]|jgi:large subunit ribosomal protein L15|nr:50S ribosomal protein L15 [Gammaproteobacteria bacterium]
MKLNSINSNEGRTNRKRVGRGVGSGTGKTCGRGHKGQKSRSGGFHKVGFEGGQMPLQRRLPKVGFSSAISRVTGEIYLYQLQQLSGTEVNMATIREAGLIKGSIKRVKLVATGDVDKAYTVTGMRVTKGAEAAIVAKGGKVEA